MNFRSKLMFTISLKRRTRKDLSCQKFSSRIHRCDIMTIVTAEETNYN